MELTAAAARGGRRPRWSACSPARILLTGATGFFGKVFLYVLLRYHPEIERIYLLIRGDRRSQPEPLPPRSARLAGVRCRCANTWARASTATSRKSSSCCWATSPKRDSWSPRARPVQRGADRRGGALRGAGQLRGLAGKGAGRQHPGVANVIEFCRKRGAALLHISTCYAAGNADGHRFEDDIPIDWCPNGRRNFNAPARNSRRARRGRARRSRIPRAGAPGRRTAVVNDERRRRRRSRSGGRATGASDGSKNGSRRMAWNARCAGDGPTPTATARASASNWCFAAQDSIAVTVVRPSVIESALSDPFPGWNQGVNTSAPLTYLSGRGYRFYPAKGDLVLDVIPVDLGGARDDPDSRGAARRTATNPSTSSALRTSIRCRCAGWSS